jgi:tripartite-type tricarboxylate transporter receptor subunit TctC
LRRFNCADVAPRAASGHLYRVPKRSRRSLAVTALNDPTVKSNLENIGMVAVGSTPEELAVLLKAEIEKWSTVIKKANIALD